MPDINLLLQTNDGHAPYAGTVIRSAVMSAAPNDILSAHVLTLGLNSDNRRKFSALAKDLGIEIRIVDVDGRLVEDMVDKGLTKTVFLRIFSGELLPWLDRVVSLDTDILVRGSLAALLDFADRGEAGAVVRDPIALRDNPDLSREVPEGFDSTGYFNSGVMCLNLGFLREQDTATQMAAILKQFPDSGFHDQSAFNVCFAGRVAYMPFSYNYFSKYDTMILKGHPHAPHIAAYFEDPKIVHFSHFKKPWRRQYPQRFAQDFLDHLRATPWGGDRLPPLGLAGSLRRAFDTVKYGYLFRRYRSSRRRGGA